MSHFPPIPVSTIDWMSIDSHEFQEVNGHVESTFNKASGTWSPLKFVSDPYLRVHGLSAGLNYGQHAFEGIKAHRMPGARGSIFIFRPDRNAIRLQHSARVIHLPEVPEDMFLRACRLAVAHNAKYVPPHESGCGIYIRPLLFGSSPMFIPGSPDECIFCVYVFPTSIGREKISPVKALILEHFDRTAPKGVGHAKVGGNYAGVVRWTAEAKAQGFGITLHLDSAKREDIDEFSTCSFLGVLSHPTIPNKVTIVVPESPCVIDSVTSDSVQHIARSWGWEVEKRPVQYDELPHFNEIIGAGTAVGLIPIRSITRREKKSREPLPGHARILSDSENSETVVYISDVQQTGGPVFCKLIDELRSLQFGTVPDRFGWRYEVTAGDILLDDDHEAVRHGPMPVI